MSAAWSRALSGLGASVSRTVADGLWGASAATRGAGVTGVMGATSATAAPAAQHVGVRSAMKKAGGSTKNQKRSNPKYLGIKLFGGQWATPGAIIVRQRGTRWHPGQNVGVGRDHTIFSAVEGRVQFGWNKFKKHTTVSVTPMERPKVQ